MLSEYRVDLGDEDDEWDFSIVVPGEDAQPGRRRYNVLYGGTKAAGSTLDPRRWPACPPRHMLLAGGGWGTKDGVQVVGNHTTVQGIRVKYVGTGLTVQGNVGGMAANNPIVAVIDGDNIQVVGNVQPVAGGPDKSGVTVPAISFPSNVCDAYAAGNDFTGAIALYEGSPPLAPCSWVDGGGNSV